MSGIWRTSQLAGEEELLHAVHAACTPTDRDRDRVFAAMIAYSLSTPAPRTAPEPAAAPHPSAPFVKQVAPSAPEPTARLLALSWPPRHVGRRSSRVWVATAVAAALMAFGMRSDFLGSTHAAGRPLAVRVAGEAKLQTGARAEREGSAARPLAAPPEARAADQPSRGEPGAAVAALAAVEPGAADTDQPSQPVKGAMAADAETPDSKRARAAEAKLLFAAERAYLNGDADLALEMLTKHRRTYPSTAYTVERKVLQGQILCTKARHGEAQRVVLELEAMDASPAALAAVERVCAGSGGR